MDERETSKASNGAKVKLKTLPSKHNTPDRQLGLRNGPRHHARYGEAGPQASPWNLVWAAVSGELQSAVHRVH